MLSSSIERNSFLQLDETCPETSAQAKMISDGVRVKKWKSVSSIKTGALAWADKG